MYVDFKIFKSVASATIDRPLTNGLATGTPVTRYIHTDHFDPNKKVRALSPPVNRAVTLSTASSELFVKTNSRSASH
jgi:hypothetical protein